VGRRDKLTYEFARLPQGRVAVQLHLKRSSVSSLDDEKLVAN